jgi:hypothetical protein
LARVSPGPGTARPPQATVDCFKMPDSV